EVLDYPAQVEQQVLEQHPLGPAELEPQLPASLGAREFDAPRPRVAGELAPALLEGEEQGALAGLHGRADELAPDQRLARTRGARHEHDRIPEVAPAADRVELGVAGRDAVAGGLLLELEHRPRDQLDAAPRPDREGEL